MQRDIEERVRLIRLASWLSIVSNGVLALLKFGGGWYGSSTAVLGDGIDSLGDALFAVVALVTARLLLRPPDALHPWGYGRAEAITTKVLSMFMLFGGLQLLLYIFQNQEIQMPGLLPLYVSGISIPVKWFLAFYKGRLGRRIHSTMLLADSRNMLNDCILSGSVLLGLSLTLWTGVAVFERVLGAGVALWILYSGARIFFESSRELMDRNEDTELYHLVFEAVATVPVLSKPHRVRIRKINHLYEVILDVLAPASLSLNDAHVYVEEMESAIRDRIPEIFDIVVHLEPHDIDQDHSKDEGFGLSPEVLEL